MLASLFGLLALPLSRWVLYSLEKDYRPVHAIFCFVAVATFIWPELLRRGIMRSGASDDKAPHTQAAGSGQGATGSSWHGAAQIIEQPSPPSSDHSKLSAPAQAGAHARKAASHLFI